MLAIDQWTVLRRDLRTGAEHIANVERTRARRGLEGEPCPVLELFRAAPWRTIHDVVRVEAYCAAHPFWGALYLCDVISTAEWHHDPWAAAMVQLHAVAQLLELHPEGQVVQRLNVLLLQDGWTLHSREAALAIVGWIAARHRNPRAFWSQPRALRHVPPDVDVGAWRDHDFTAAASPVRGVNGSAKVTWTLGRGDLALDYDELRRIALTGHSATVRWLEAQSAAGDQTRFADLDAPRVRAAAADKASRLLVEAPPPPPRAAAIAAALGLADASQSLAALMAAAHGAHMAGEDPDGHWGILASIVAGCIVDYALHPDLAGAARVDAEIRARNGL